MMVPSKETAPISCRIALRRIELFSSSVNTDARLVVEERLLYTVEVLLRVVTT